MKCQVKEKRRHKRKGSKLILPVLFFVMLGGTVISKNSFSDTINLGNANVISNVLSSDGQYGAGL